MAVIGLKLTLQWLTYGVVHLLRNALIGGLKFVTVYSRMVHGIKIRKKPLKNFLGYVTNKRPL